MVKDQLTTDEVHFSIPVSPIHLLIKSFDATNL
jgi:hypothetical protein